MVGRGAEGLDGAAHGQDPRPVDVHAIDLVRFDESHGRRDGRLSNERCETLALFGGELFRVVDAGKTKTGREDDRTGSDRSGEWAHPRFVDARDTGDARGPERAFEAEDATQ